MKTGYIIGNFNSKRFSIWRSLWIGQYRYYDFDIHIGRLRLKMRWASPLGTEPECKK